MDYWINLIDFSLSFSVKNMSLKSLEEWMNPFHFWKDSTQNACLQNIWITGLVD